MEESSLEELKSKLYSKKISLDAKKRDIKFKLQDDSPGLKSEWGDKEEKIEDVVQMANLRNKPISTMVKKFIYLSIAFALLVVTSTVFYFWLKGSGVVTPGKNIEVKLGGPVSVAAGEPLSLYLEIKNKGNINIDSADLVLEYPPGMRPKNNPNLELGRDRKTIGGLRAGESYNQIIEIVAFGEGGSEKTVNAKVEYKLENSSAILINEGAHTFKISQSPIDITLNFPVEIRTKQEVDFEVEIKSNSSSLVKDLYLQIEYPPGFQFVSSKPEPIKENLWALGDLMQGASKKIIITGLIEGQESEEKFFHAQVGTLLEDTINNIYASSNKGISLRSSAFNITVLINSNDLEKNTTSSGERVTGQIMWENNLPVAVRDASVNLKISGSAFDPASILTEKGFYRTSDGILVWNKSTLSSLVSIDPGQSGYAKFSFLVKKPLPVLTVSDKNFIVTLDASMFGKKVESIGENLEVKSEITKKILVNSDIQFAVRGLYYSGPFLNSGPIPPKVGMETTYTIVWSLTNSSNDVSGTKVRAVLPAYMRWMGVVAPSGSSVSFDESTSIITWDKGLLKAGVGILSPAEEVAFQVALLPAPNQVGKTPEILMASKTTGTDSFTGKEMIVDKSAVKTASNGDSKIKTRDGMVVE
jgi:hypothetical protein